MNAMTKDLSNLIKKAESNAFCGPFRQRLHLMPPVGWLNDPNGLCQFQGVYHAFFQYSPFDPEGGLKLWGHSTSKDMLTWEYQGTALYPDQPFDCTGVYSGCAFIEQDKMYLHYTGNVKLEDGEYDYIQSGREGNTVLVESSDGMTLGPKKLLMRNSDYPSNLSCHVRDPKVWKEHGRYYMIQGARTKDDVGLAIIFSSEDKVNWTFEKEVKTSYGFGYMWECPDYFETDGHKVLSASVQGLTGGIWKDRNVYQSGYFQVDGDLLGDYRLSEYFLWDYGFDYYAPQSFHTEDGRTILIAWMGMPDCEEYGNQPTIQEGWQHCFTFPREIYAKDGRICQRPVRELDNRMISDTQADHRLTIQNQKAYVAKIRGIQKNNFQANLSGGLFLEYTQGRFQMRFADQKKEGLSGGRSLRYLELDNLETITILADVSSVEVFVNNGEAVFSTRYYPESYSLDIQAEGAHINFSKL